MHKCTSTLKFSPVTKAILLNTLAYFKSNPLRWIKHYHATNKFNAVVPPEADDAVNFCLFGRLMNQYERKIAFAVNSEYHNITKSTFVEDNDTSNTVSAMIRKVEGRIKKHS